MKTMRFFLLAIGILTALQTYAQTPSRTDRQEQLQNSTPEQRANRQTAQMKKNLSLTTEQETAVGAINLKYAQQMQPILEQANRNRETMKDVRQIQQAKDAEIRKILTSSQLEQYNNQRDERREQLRDRKRN
jgi:Spy/CpxP family protein refolding chaperone